MLRFKDYATKITASLQYHIENSIPLANNIYRTHSQEFYALFNEAREMYREGSLIVESDFDKQLLETDIGEHGIYEGEKVPLDIPIAEYDEDESKFYRFVMPEHINRGVQDREF